MCCAAAMYVKGEGMGQPNASRAIELYTEAADLGSVKALNGLGYIYFYGQGGVTKNLVMWFICFSGKIMSSYDMYVYIIYIID